MPLACRGGLPPTLTAPAAAAAGGAKAAEGAPPRPCGALCALTSLALTPAPVGITLFLEPLPSPPPSRPGAEVDSASCPDELLGKSLGSGDDMGTGEPEMTAGKNDSACRS